MRFQRKGSDESLSFAEAQAKKKLAQKGKSTEAQVADVLKSWKASDARFDYDRLVDSRAAGAIIEAQCCDFMLYSWKKTIALEVKEIKKGTRLPSFVQLPRLLRREKTGVAGWVLVHFLDSAKWVATRATAFEGAQEAASWNLAGMPGWCDTAEEALKYIEQRSDQWANPKE